MLEQAKKMKEDFQRVQEAAAKKTVETSSGGGMVKIVMNGKQQMVSLAIDPEVLKMNDPVLLQDLVLGAVNQAVKASQDMMAQEMGKLSGSLGSLASMFNKGD